MRENRISRLKVTVKLLKINIILLVFFQTVHLIIVHNRCTVTEKICFVFIEEKAKFHVEKKHDNRDTISAYHSSVSYLEQANLSNRILFTRMLYQ